MIGEVAVVAGVTALERKPKPAGLDVVVVVEKDAENGRPAAKTTRWQILVEVVIVSSTCIVGIGKSGGQVCFDERGACLQGRLYNQDGFQSDGTVQRQQCCDERDAVSDEVVQQHQ